VKKRLVTHNPGDESVLHENLSGQGSGIYSLSLILTEALERVLFQIIEAVLGQCLGSTLSHSFLVSNWKIWMTRATANQEVPMAGSSAAIRR
jgi:hypothetical protein